MFCQSCGAQMSGAFCTKCGARSTEAAPPPAQAGGPPPPQYNPPPPQYNPPPPQYNPPPPQYNPPPPQYAPPPAQYAPPPQQYAAQPLPPASSGGSGLKILFVVLGVMAMLGMLVIGGIWYGWHKVKQVAASKGVDLNSFSETQHGPARRLDACELISKEELSQILNMPVERSEGSGRSSHSSCRYFSSAAVQRGSDEATEAIKKLQEAKGGTSAEQEEAMKNLGTMVRGMAGVAGASENAPMLSIELETNNAKAAMATFKLAMNITTIGVPKDADPKVRKLMMEEVPGVADEAVFGPLLSLFIFRKGDVAVTMDARALPGGRDSELAIAKRIVAKL